MKRFYLDTSIWLDLLENRNEPNMPKGRWARDMIARIIERGDEIIVSDFILLELERAGYSKQELDTTFNKLAPIIVRIDAFERDRRRAKDIAAKKDVPRLDALHAVIASNHKATLVSLDPHFKQLDIIDVQAPKDV
jgi:predicted nucleic acid-binding protein